jgi:exodeoxyribonuclease VII large subunit
MMTVNSLNIKIKSLLEATFMHIQVEGEIASVTYHQASGHIYFSIKDDKSSIKCVMFRSNAQRLKFRLEKGERIIVEGSVGVYTPRGEYQFYAVHIEPFGRGALALAYEQLKEKLKQKGYFDQANKKAIPKTIQKLALVTAKESAALHDMIKIIEKRWPLIEVKIIDTLVQGEHAPREIAQALQYADNLGVDLIIVGRGGGSTEDLWAFNEEIVADTIFTLKTPIVSAVGHEIDMPISDFVADMRAPTPSAAIEMILPDKQEVLYAINEIEERYSQTMHQILYHKSIQIEQNRENLGRFSVKRRLQELSQTFNNIQNEYKRIIQYKVLEFSSKPPKIEDGIKQQLSFILNQKYQQKSILLQRFQTNNPRDGIKDGWAKVSKNGKIVSLSAIKINETFFLEDVNTKIEANCSKRMTF